MSFAICWLIKMMPTSDLVDKSLNVWAIWEVVVSDFTTRKLEFSAVLWPQPARRKPVTVSESPIIATSLPSDSCLLVGLGLRVCEREG